MRLLTSTNLNVSVVEVLRRILIIYFFYFPISKVMKFSKNFFLMPSFLTLFILIFSFIFSKSTAIASEQKDYENNGLDDNWVEVEIPPNIILFDPSGNKRPYSERRSSWNTTFAFGLSQFNPTLYQSAFVQQSIDDNYGDPDLSLLDLDFGVNKNFSFGALSFNLGVGAYHNKTKSAVDVKELQIIPIRFQCGLILNNLMNTPYVAPYFFGGIYQISYEEKVTYSSDGVTEVIMQGETYPAFHYGLGILIQLNWLEEHTSEQAFLNYDIENTFLYFEARGFMSDGQDLDFSTDPQLGAGFKIDF